MHGFGLVIVVEGSNIFSLFTLLLVLGFNKFFSSPTKYSFALMPCNSTGKTKDYTVHKKFRWLR